MLRFNSVGYINENKQYLTDIDEKRLYKDDLLIRDKIIKLKPEVDEVLQKVYNELLSLANKSISEYESLNKKAV